jgi:hypothetical protein
LSRIFLTRVGRSVAEQISHARERTDAQRSINATELWVPDRNGTSYVAIHPPRFHVLAEESLSVGELYLIEATASARFNSVLTKYLSEGLSESIFTVYALSEFSNPNLVASVITLATDLARL